MKTFYKKFMALVIMLFALTAASSTSFAQESGKKNDWKYGHFTSEAEYIQHINGTRTGGHFAETNPPTGNVRFPAEFEKMQGVIIAYPYDGFGLPTNMIADITESCKTYILVSSSDQRYAERELRSANANMNNVVIWNMNIDSYWSRDFGPWYIFNDNDPAIVDFVYNRPRANDDDAPINIANNYQHLPLYGMNLQHTGGNMMQDGRGTGVSDMLVVNENTNETTVRQKMNDYLNIDPYHITIDPQGQYIAHVDCWGKLLAPDKILVARMPQNDSRYQYYEEVANYFATTNCCYGYPYKVYRVDELSSAENGTLAPYTNSLILNDKVYVPLGTNNTYNNNALAVYEEAMPGYEIIGISSPRYNPWLNTDAIHCRVRGIMDFNMMFVDHRNVIYGEEIDYQSNYTVNADLIAYSGAAVTTAQLVYRVNDGDWNYVNMTNTTGDTYTANIPGVYGAEIDYYITATDANGNTGNQPMMGAVDPHHFQVEANIYGSVDFSVASTTVPFNTNVHFNNLSTIVDDTDYEWIFEGGTPATSNLNSPDVVYTTPGTYDVTLTVTNALGMTFTITKEDYITVVNEVYMHNGEVHTCGTSFFDAGGPDGGYGEDDAYVLTFYPCGDATHTSVKVDFTSFAINNYSTLKVYNGKTPSTGSLIGTYSGTNIQSEFKADNAFGALTFKFDSYGHTGEGWAASVTCVEDPIFDITCMTDIDHGSISAPQTAYEGDPITVTITPDQGWRIGTLYYIDDQNHQVNVDMTTFSFNMPASDITIGATFTDLPDQHDVVMVNGTNTYVADNIMFYDDGGANGNYSNGIRTMIATFNPDLEEGESGVVQAVFNSFNTENRYDKLYVYDGANTSARLIGTYTGSVNPGTILSTTGSLTFKFTSDNSVNRPGWAAEITTVRYERYNITCNNTTPSLGTLTADKAQAYIGETITLTVTPANDNVFLKSLTVKDIYDNNIEVVDNQFVMPSSNVTVTCRFAQGIYHAEHYELVTSEYELEAGERYLIASGNSGNVYAMSDQASSFANYYLTYYRTAVDVTVVNDQISAEDANGAFEFLLGGEDGAYNFFDEYENGYVYCYRYKSGSSYIYALNTLINPQAQYRDWDITIDEDGAATVLNTYYYRNMGFDGTSKFMLYTLGQAKSVYLFKKIEGYWEEIGAKEVLSVNENAEIPANVYPNPTTGNITLQAEGMQQISVFNVMGQEVMSLSANSDMETLDLGGLDAGMYIIRICTENGIAVKRVNLMH